MGCKSSKVATTAEEIVTRRREIKFTTAWWKKKFQKQTISDKKEPVPFTRTLSACSGEETPLYFRTEDSLLEVQSISSFECLPDVRLGNCTPMNKPNPLKEKTKTPSPEAKTTSEDDLSTDDLEDDVSLTDYLSTAYPPMPVSRTRSELPNEDTRTPKPTVLHNAWSEGSVAKRAPRTSRPQRNILTVTQEKLQVAFPDHHEAPKAISHECGPTSRQRPKAAKGNRQAPDLTDVYRAELSIPGTPMENPKRQQEKQCLDAWMERCLGDGAK